MSDLVRRYPELELYAIPTYLPTYLPTLLTRTCGQNLTWHRAELQRVEVRLDWTATQWDSGREVPWGSTTGTAKSSGHTQYSHW